jgi:hypothetical protein
MPAIWLLGGGKAPDKVSQWGKPPGIYNIVDDDPAPVHDWLPALASMAGAKPPLRSWRQGFAEVVRSLKPG